MAPPMGLTCHCLHRGFWPRRGHPLPQPVGRRQPGLAVHSSQQPLPPAATRCRCRERHSPMAGHPAGCGPRLPWAAWDVGTVGGDSRAGPRHRTVEGHAFGAAGRPEDGCACRWGPGRHLGSFHKTDYTRILGLGGIKTNIIQAGFMMSDGMYYILFVTV